MQRQRQIERLARVARKFGVFQDADEACAAAQEAFLQLQQKGVEARRRSKRSSRPRREKR